MSNNGKSSSDARHDIQEILFRFMRSFDTKDWDSMAACLDDRIYCDYSDLRHDQPGYVLRDQYVKQRKDAHSLLKTQHNLFNLSIENIENKASVLCNYCIYRFDNQLSSAEENYFHSYGQYLFDLHWDDRDWKIISITQKLLMNQGNQKLHKGIRK